MDKFNMKMEGTSLVGGYDGDSDGKNSISFKLNLQEVYGELLAKGEAKLDVKAISFKMVGSKITAVIDSDKDGQAVLEIDADLLEGLKEASIG